MCRVAGTPDPTMFVDGGHRSVRELELALHVVDRSLSSYRRILDFGCGCGRTMRFMRPLAQQGSLHGTDVDVRAIRWAQKNLSYASFEVNGELPPLAYPDHHFDLVYSHSVFSHLDEDYQDRWLAELKRVTAPGGHLVLTMHGPNALLKISNDLRAIGEDPQPLHDVLERDGILFVKDDAWVGSPFPDSYHTSVHSPSYLLEHWGQLFFVRAYLPQHSLGFQDVVVLERLPDDTPTPARLRLCAQPPPEPSTDAAPAKRFVAARLRPATRSAVKWIQHHLTRRLPLRHMINRRAGVAAVDEMPFNETTQRHILQSMGERINRLEAEVLDVIAAHETRIAEVTDTVRSLMKAEKP